MMQDAFETWYKKYNPDLDPEGDDAYDELWDCWKTAWKRSKEIDDALTELVQIAQEAGEYD